MESNKCLKIWTNGLLLAEPMFLEHHWVLYYYVLSKELCQDIMLSVWLTGKYTITN